MHSSDRDSDERAVRERGRNCAGEETGLESAASASPKSVCRALPSAIAWELRKRFTRLVERRRWGKEDRRFHGKLGDGAVRLLGRQGSVRLLHVVPQQRVYRSPAGGQRGARGAGGSCQRGGCDVHRGRRTPQAPCATRPRLGPHCAKANQPTVIVDDCPDMSMSLALAGAARAREALRRLGNAVAHTASAPGRAVRGRGLKRPRQCVDGLARTSGSSDVDGKKMRPMSSIGAVHSGRGRGGSRHGKGVHFACEAPTLRQTEHVIPRENV